MSDKHSRAQIEAFFLQHGLTSALFFWLSFRQHMHSGLLNTLPQQHNHTSALGALTQWQTEGVIGFQQQQNATLGLRLATTIAAMAGVGAMTATLNYSADYMINIWLPLLLFALLPLLTSIVTVSLLIWRRGEVAPVSSPFFNHLVQRWHLDDLKSHRSLIFGWLGWQLQSLAIAFSIAAIVTFAVLALFQQYQFGWSSTLMKDANAVTAALSTLAWPWQSFLGDIEPLMRATRMTNEEAPSAASLLVEGNKAWWWQLFMFMVVYGLLPRLCLSFWLKRTLVKHLRNDINQSGDIELLQNALHRQTSLDAMLPETQAEQSAEHPTSTVPTSVNTSTPPTSASFISGERPIFISWQLAQRHYKVDYCLGAQNWQDDQAWIEQQTYTNDQTLILIIEPWQTPTGDLSDCIDDLHARGAKLCLGLVESASSDPLLPDERKALQAKTWQHFAHTAHLALLKIHEKEGELSCEPN